MLRQHILFNQLLLGKIIKAVFSKHVCNLFLPVFPLPKNPILQIRGKTPITYSINREMNTQQNVAKMNLFPTKTIKVTNFTQSCIPSSFLSLFPLLFITLFLFSTSFNTHLVVPLEQRGLLEDGFHLEREDEDVLHGRQEGEGCVAGVQVQGCLVGESPHEEDDGPVLVNPGSRFHGARHQRGWLQALRCLQENDAFAKVEHLLRCQVVLGHGQVGEDTAGQEGDLVQNARDKAETEAYLDFPQHFCFPGAFGGVPPTWMLRRDKEQQKEEPVISHQDWETEGRGLG